MSKPKKAVEQQDVAVEEKPWSPEYPGQLPPLQLPPEEVARLEAERASIVASLVGGYTAKPTPKAEPVIEPVIEAPVAEVEPLEPNAVEIAKAKVKALEEAHRQQVEAAEENYKRVMADTLRELSAAEVAEARALDARSGAVLNELLEDLGAGVVNATVREAKKQQVFDRAESLRRRAAPAFAQAAEARKALKAFDKEFEEPLDKLAAINRTEFLMGTPTEGQGAAIANALYEAIHVGITGVRKARESLGEMLSLDQPRIYKGETSSAYERDLLNLIAQSERDWTQEHEVSFMWSLTRLLLATPDSVENLRVMIRGPINAALRLNGMKSPANTGTVRTIKMLPEPSVADMASMGMLPDRGASYSVFPQEAN